MMRVRGTAVRPENQFVCSRTDADTLSVEIYRAESRMNVSRRCRIGTVTGEDVVCSEWSTNAVQSVPVVPDQTPAGDCFRFFVE